MSDGLPDTKPSIFPGLRPPQHHEAVVCDKTNHIKIIISAVLNQDVTKSNTLVPD